MSAMSLMTSLAAHVGLTVAGAEPWLADGNRVLLQKLFQLLPHTWWRSSFAEFLVLNPLVTTWIYAAIFYWFWRKTDDRALWRRTQLLVAVLGVLAAVAASLVLRSWVSWPSPTRVASFQGLFPKYLWEYGNANCFPSHSTLVYVAVAAGLWLLNRRVSVLLGAFALVAVALPRVYVGGHYPIDILASVLLALLCGWGVRWVCAWRFLSERIERVARGGELVEFLIFLWLFELAERFDSARQIVSAALKLIRRVR